MERKTLHQCESSPFCDSFDLLRLARDVLTTGNITGAPVNGCSRQVFIAKLRSLPPDSSIFASGGACLLFGLLLRAQCETEPTLTAIAHDMPVTPI